MTSFRWCSPHRVSPYSPVPAGRSHDLSFGMALLEPVGGICVSFLRWLPRMKGFNDRYSICRRLHSMVLSSTCSLVL